MEKQQKKKKQQKNNQTNTQTPKSLVYRKTKSMTEEEGEYGGGEKRERGRSSIQSTVSVIGRTEHDINR